MLELFKFIQVAINWPNVFVSAWVLFAWRNTIRNFFGNHPVSANHLAVGVIVHFCFGVVDHSYWAQTWELDYIGSPSAQWWFDHGPVSNVLSRLIGNGIAGYCHIKAAHTYNDKSTKYLVPKIFGVYAVGFLYANQL